MGQIVPLSNIKKDFNYYVKELAKLCEKDLNSINALILEKLDSEVPLIKEIDGDAKINGYSILFNISLHILVTKINHAVFS